ncbi:PREDICTED: DAN domain family member 5 [Elephantulus edwardii]|uniref:DAN domain family member 5 n=1 Tax=Elephantulus edwardii TaxID=28737 RepID=UPI0003F06EB5|nr:PREDICTED: DAN domain family member 5 [Elephantulus edwardii]
MGASDVEGVLDGPPRSAEGCRQRASAPLSAPACGVDGAREPLQRLLPTALRPRSISPGREMRDTEVSGAGLAFVPQGPPRQPWTQNTTWVLSEEVPGAQRPVSALGSWKAFLGLQKTKWLETVQGGQEVATATTVSLPLDPREVAYETCKARPFTQVLSRPGCTSVRLRNHLCFGHCSSFYVPSSDPSPIVLCSSCLPTRKRWTRVALWCWTGSPASRRRVKVPTVLVEGCRCRPKP